MSIPSIAAADDIQVALRNFKAEFFHALSNPTRVHIVELLRDSELPTSELLARLGVEQANGSQHLAVLRAAGIVLNRKEGNQVFYRLRDPMIGEVLNTLRKYFHTHLQQSVSMLKEMADEEGAR